MIKCAIKGWRGQWADKTPAESVPGLNNGEIAPISSPHGIGIQYQTTLASPLGSELLGVIWLTLCSGYDSFLYCILWSLRMVIDQGFLGGCTPKKIWWGSADLVFDQIPLAKEILVENIPLAKENFFYHEPSMILRNFSPNIPFLREIFRKQTLI